MVNGKMHTITQSCALLLWLHTVTFVQCQDCTLQNFREGDLFDANFDTSGLDDIYTNGQQVRVPCHVGFFGFYKLICSAGEWQFRGKKCQPKSCGHPGDAQFAEFHLDKGDEYVFGSQVVYTCNKGYQMVSRIFSRRCMANGWDGVIPVCEAINCPVMNVDQSVQVNGNLENANFGNVVQFSCRSSSEMLYGSSEVYCDENGVWSGEAPKCKEIKCDAPQIENGAVLAYVQEYKEHEILRFRCNRGYKAVDGRSPTCTKSGIRAEWIPEPACEEITCKLVLPPVPGTSYEPAFSSMFSPGRSVKVMCGDTYWISREESRSAVSTCRENGEWSIEPTCKEVKCRTQRPEHVSWWEISWWSNIQMGTTASYRCASGYRPKDGATQVRCDRGGWQPNPPCEEIKCDAPQIENGAVLGNVQEYKENEILRFRCNRGYKAVDRRSPTCTRSGIRAEWIPEPACEEITCKLALPPVPGTSYEPAFRSMFSPGRSVKVMCGDTYWISREESRSAVSTCRENGEWSIEPTCKEVKCRNQQPEHVSWWEISWWANIQMGTTASYQCASGYRPKDGATQVRCDRGGWQPNPPCEAIGQQACSKPTIPDGFLVGPLKNKVYYTCNGAYKLFSGGWWGVATCNQGLWSGIIACIGQNSCGEMPVIPNAEMKPRQGATADNQRVPIVCKSGYQAQVDHLTCRRGKWRSNELPLKAICTPLAKPCGPPSRVANAVITELYEKTYLSDSAVTYQCRENYTMKGKATIRCTDGEWEQVNTSCTYTGKPCGPPPLVESASILEPNESYLPDSVVTYRCLDNYKMEGNATIRCADGEWERADIGCAPVTCDPPPAVDNLMVIGLQHSAEKINPGKVLRFNCRNSMILTGKPYLTCGQDGQWNHPFPSCEEQQQH